MRLKWARSATKHRISRKRSRFVIEHCGLVLEQPAPSASPTGDPRLVYLGDDETGTQIEVMAIELDDGGLLVIHAMPMRERYRPDYEEVLKWRI